MRNKTFYEILNVTRTASQREIRENYLVLKYLMLSKIDKSDLSQDDIEMPEIINFAYWTLKDEKRRREYDLMLKSEETSEDRDIKVDTESIGELSNFQTKVIGYLSHKRLRVAFLVTSVFFFCFYGDFSDMSNVAIREVIFAASILLYFLTLMSVMQML